MGGVLGGNNGMISPAQQKIIQIDITNACPHKCANCTRFVGHHKKPFMMTLDQFKCAVDSLSGFKGMIGVMGGEPTIHPQFAEIVECLSQKVPQKLIVKDRFKPIRDFVAYRNKNLGSLRARSGLWTSLGTGYYKNYELIQDNFGYQCINDHSHQGQHMALMITRKELGIPDDQWIKFRDNCWVQRKWSSSITPKGAFFCEVAAALDILFDGPGGWPVEKGWWTRRPKDFGEQLRWCEMCSACLPVPHAVASSGKDIVSPEMVKKLQEISSPKVKSGMVNVFDTSKYKENAYQVNDSAEPYLPDDQGNNARVSTTNNSIKPQKIAAIIICLNYSDYLALTLPHVVNAVDEVVVVTDEEDSRTKSICESIGVKCLISKNIHADKAIFAKGRAINDALDSIENKDWILVLDADVVLNNDFKQKIKSLTLNPGALYYTRRWGPKQVSDIKPIMDDINAGTSWSHLLVKWEDKSPTGIIRDGNSMEIQPFGYFQLFNARASALKGRTKIYSEVSDTAQWDDAFFGMRVYPTDHVILLPVPDFDVIHLPHRNKVNWTGRKTEDINGDALQIVTAEESATFSVSVIVVTHNCESSIKRCLTGLLNQTYPKHLFEILVIDCGSTDSTLKKVEAFSSVKCIRVDKLNVSQARNMGIIHSNGDIVAFCDAIARPSQAWLLELIQPLSLPDVIATTGNIDVESYQTPQNSFFSYKNELNKEGTFLSNYSALAVFTNSAYKKTVFKEIGEFNPILNRAFVDEEYIHRIKSNTKYRTLNLFSAKLLLDLELKHIFENYYYYGQGMRQYTTDFKLIDFNRALFENHTCHVATFFLTLGNRLTQFTKHVRNSMQIFFKVNGILSFFMFLLFGWFYYLIYGMAFCFVSIQMRRNKHYYLFPFFEYIRELALHVGFLKKKLV